METNARIAVRRGKMFRDKLRGYKILVDDQLAGMLREGGEVAVDVPPGRHFVQAKVDWCKSEPLAIDVGAGETAVVETSGRPHLLGVIDAFFRWNRYVELRRADDATS